MTVNVTDARHLDKFKLEATASWWSRLPPPPNATNFAPLLVEAKPVVYLPVKRRGGTNQYVGAQIHIQIVEAEKQRLNFEIKSLVGSPVKVDILNMMRAFAGDTMQKSLPDSKLDASLSCFINIPADTIKSLMDPDGPMKARVNENLLDFLVEIPAIKIDGKPLQGNSTNRLFVYCRKTIVFLPGVFGSEIGLVAKDGEGAGFPHFLNIRILHPTAGFRIGNLECDVKGEPVLPAPHPKLFKKAVHLKSVYETFDKVKEARRQRLLSVPDEFLVYMLQAFSYDWRGDLTKAAESMMQRLRELQERLRKRDDTDDQVAIAGHSTGGVIIRRMLGEPGADSLISHAFFLNVPFRGAPKALSVMVTGRDPPGGDPMIPGMDPYSMLAIAPTAPIVYHLAPSAKYPTPVAQILPDGIPPGPLPDREREKAALIDAALRRGILHPAAPVCVPLDSLEERLAVADGADDWNDFVRWRNRHSDGDALYQYESERGGSVGETHFSLPAKKLAESAALQLQAARRISMAWSTELAKQAQTFHETSERIAAGGTWAEKAYIFYTKEHDTTVSVKIEPQGGLTQCNVVSMYSDANTTNTFLDGEAKPAEPKESENPLVVEQWQYQAGTLWRAHSQVSATTDDGDGTVPRVSLLGFGGPAKVFKPLPGNPKHVPAPNSEWLWSRVMDVLQGHDVSDFLLTSANTTNGTES
jgi:hypothetical protein